MANAAIYYDKHAVIQKLQQRGFPHDQAEGIAEALTAIDASELSTKSDLKDLELRLYSSRPVSTLGGSVAIRRPEPLR